MQFLEALFSSGPFMPDGYCYRWNLRLLWLHVVSDSLIALAYLSIPFTLLYFVRKRRDLPFHWMFACFGIFILACGATHAMEVWTLWHANYWVSGSIKAITALASVSTAILLVRLVPHTMELPSAAVLQLEIAERTRAEENLSLAKADLERRVDKRTAELKRVNEDRVLEINRRSSIDRQQVDEELRRSEERFRLLVEGIADYAIVMLDPAGFVSSWNSGAEHILGYSAQEIIGQQCFCFYDDEDLRKGKPATALREAAAAGRFEEDGWQLRNDGSRFRVNAILTALRGPQGELIGFSKITRDLTESRRAEEAVQMAHAELARVVRASTMGELTASIAHEINQPLAIIINNANASRRILADPVPNIEEVQSAISDIAEAGARAAGIIAHIRALLEKSAPEKKTLDMNQVIHQVLALIPGVLEKQHVSVEMELRPAIPAVLGGNVRLQQVLLNLIMNGIEAMDTILDRRRVLTIRSDVRESGLEFAVQDSGNGLDPKHTEHIFDTLFTTKSSGLGMGLSISRSIIEAHNGRLWASSDPADQGATFRFFLPAAG
jgi:PAS domain S-box-containing protein